MRVDAMCLRSNKSPGTSTRTAHVLAVTHAGELAAEELRQAQHALGEITGTYSSDDLLGAIFSSFCIGK